MSIGSHEEEHAEAFLGAGAKNFQVCSSWKISLLPVTKHKAKELPWERWKANFRVGA